MSFLETLTSAFKGGGGSRAPLSSGAPYGVPMPWIYGQDATASAPPPYQYSRSVRRAFLDNPVAQRAVRIVAEGVGSAPMTETDPAIAELVGATSAGQSLIETVAAHTLLHGNAYVQIIKDATGQPIELFALRPDRVTIAQGKNGWPASYRYSVGDNDVNLPIEDADGWPNVIHIKAFHPIDDHYGASALAAAEQSVAVHNAAALWNRSLLENAARPSGALVYEAGDQSELTTDQFERLKAELLQAFSGSGNAGRPMLLEGGLKWQSLSMSPADMDFAELKAAAARDIALSFGVPPMLLGLPGDNTYSNYKEANRALWRLTLLPLAEKILAGLTQGLTPWFPDAKLAVDLDRVTALSEDRERLWSQVNDADFLTQDEKRAMLGLAPSTPAEDDKSQGDDT